MGEVELRVIEVQYHHPLAQAIFYVGGKQSTLKVVLPVPPLAEKKEMTFIRLNSKTTLRHILADKGKIHLPNSQISKRKVSHYATCFAGKKADLPDGLPRTDYQYPSRGFEQSVF